MKLSELICLEEFSLDRYIEFREFVKSKMEHPEWLGNFTKEDLTFLLEQESKIWIYALKDQFVCSMMFIPADEKTISKFGLNLNYLEIADYGPMFVHPDYRGHSLQYQMLQEIDSYSKENGYLWAASTIHPDNIYSIQNLLKDGFEMKGQREFSRGIRNIYLKELKK